MPDAPSLDFAASPLDPVAVRVLACLVEKEFLTPATYPLTLNALTTACNQSSNRDPVMALEEADVAAAISELARRGLVREMLRSDSRVKRYRHTLEDALHLHDHERAALCVLMLRGAQTPGEINARTGRMADFVDLSHVTIALDALAAFEPPLAAQLPRQVGQKEARYSHLLSGSAAGGGGAAGAPVSEAPAGSEPAGDAAVSQPRAAAAGSSVGSGDLAEEVRTLREEIARLRAEFEAFRQEFR